MQTSPDGLVARAWKRSVAGVSLTTRRMGRNECALASTGCRAAADSSVAAPASASHTLCIRQWWPRSRTAPLSWRRSERPSAPRVPRRGRAGADRPRQSRARQGNSKGSRLGARASRDSLSSAEEAGQAGVLVLRLAGGAGARGLGRALEVLPVWRCAFRRPGVLRADRPEARQPESLAGDPALERSSGQLVPQRSLEQPLFQGPRALPRRGVPPDGGVERSGGRVAAAHLNRQPRALQRKERRLPPARRRSFHWSRTASTTPGTTSRRQWAGCFGRWGRSTRRRSAGTSRHTRRRWARPLSPARSSGGVRTTAHGFGSCGNPLSPDGV